jgi:hypothetical protein
MSHDRVGALAIFLSDFIEARYVGISLLLLGVADEATIGTDRAASSFPRSAFGTFVTGAATVAPLATRKSMESG